MPIPWEQNWNDVKYKNRIYEHKISLNKFFVINNLAQSAGAVEYTDCFSAEG